MAFGVLKIFKNFRISRTKKPCVPRIPRNTITIYMSNGRHVCFPFDGEYTKPSDPWNEFYTWFQDETTDSFIFTYPKGEMVVTRRNIVSWEVEVK